jgi:phosphoribosylformylglycinamidine cyclo-ligase
MTKEEAVTRLSYADSGVNIDAQSRFVERIKGLVKKTPRQGVLSGVGGFAAMYELPLDKYASPVLVSGSDGVGTKLKLAHLLNKHDTIGIDLVAMCVNDVLCHRADPLYFLDYFATGRLNIEQAEAVISGIVEGCQQAGISLIGGETAELPGLYHGDDYDLAGFCVGIVDKPQVIDASKVKAGDAVLALASSGPHSNGYSLIRKVVELAADGVDTALGSQSLGEALLEPTRIYVRSLQALWARVDVHGLAHITGGGMVENLPRVLPGNMKAVLSRNSWQWPEVFNWIQTRGNVADSEMMRTFNLGVGMMVVVAQEEAELALDILSSEGESVWQIGTVEFSGDGSSEGVQWK